MEDIAIVKSIQKGNKDDYVKLYDKYIKKIYDFVYYKIGNKEEAEDLTSEIFLKVYDSIDRFDTSKDSGFSSWLYKIANNQIVDFYRSKKEIIDTDMITERPVYEDMLSGIQNRDKIKEVLDFLDTLDPIHKDIFIMRIWNDMSYNEIAEVVGKSVDNCKQIFSRSMKKIVSNVSVEALLLFIFLVR